MLTTNSQWRDTDQGKPEDIKEYMIDEHLDCDKLVRLLLSLDLIFTEKVDIKELGKVIKVFENIRDKENLEMYSATMFERRCNLEGIYKYEDIGIVAVEVIKALGLESLNTVDIIQNIHIAEAITTMTTIFININFEKIKPLLTKPKEPTEEELKNIHKLFSNSIEEFK